MTARRTAAHAALLLLFAPIALGVEECPDEGAPPADDGGDVDFPDGDEDAGDVTAGDCAPVRYLVCGEAIEGDTADVNDGATDAIDGYPIAVGNYSGAEIAYAFTATTTEEVTWRLLDPDPTELNHDLFVLSGDDGTCNSAQAVERGFNDVSFEAEAGSTYFLVVDGFDGDAGAFRAELECTGGVDGGELDPDPSGASAEVIMSPLPYDESHLARTAELLDGAEVSIDLAMYSFRDNGVMEAIGRARARGVSVRALLESAQKDRTDPEGTKSAQLEEMGAEVRWVNKIMHHKFALIDGPRTDASAATTATLVTGSANWSYSAGTRYDENTVVAVGDEKLNLAFQQEFDHLWANSRDLVWNEDIAPVVTVAIDDDQVAAADGSEAVFTTANMNTYVSSYGPTFSAQSGSGAARDALADFIAGADESIWIASGHLRSRQITDAILAAWEANPGLDLRVYLDGQEYVSDGYWEDEVAAYDECVTEASTTTQMNHCEDKGLHFGWQLAQAGVDLRYKYYSYRWHYSYAVQMHHKYVIVDGVQVASGSYNFSNNAEHDTVENLVFYDADRYPELVSDFIDNFDAIWATGTGSEYEALMAQVTSGEDFPIVFESMALPHDDVTALKAAIYDHCPDIDSEDYKSRPQSHMTCEL